MADEDAGLQEEVDAWLQRNWDPDLTVREWWERVGDAGWTAPTARNAFQTVLSDRRE